MDVFFCAVDVKFCEMDESDGSCHEEKSDALQLKFAEKGEFGV
jgi:hypothetical protein